MRHTIPHLCLSQFNTALCSFKFIVAYPSHGQVKSLAQRLIVASELNADDLDKADLKGLMKAKQAVAQMRLGSYKTEYSLTIDLPQARKGDIMLDTCRLKG